MASETLIENCITIRIYNLVLTHLSLWVLNLMLVFLVPGPRMVCYFNKVINPESFASIGIKKVLPDIETSMSLAYAAGGKLNDIQTNKIN